MLSFTLSGKHILQLIQIHMHIHNFNKCIIITDIRNFMHSYHERIQVLKLITGLCSFGTPVGVTELILMQDLYL